MDMDFVYTYVIPILIMVGVPATLLTILAIVLEIRRRRVVFNVYGHDVRPHVLDRSTGLPALPEGWFWEIDKSPNTKGILYLYMHSPAQTDETLVNILTSNKRREQRELLIERAEDILYRFKPLPEDKRDKYIGTYPPKSLKD